MNATPTTLFRCDLCEQDFAHAGNLKRHCSTSKSHLEKCGRVVKPAAVVEQPVAPVAAAEPPVDAIATQLAALAETVAGLVETVAVLEAKNEKLKTKVKALKVQHKELFASMKAAPNVVYLTAPSTVGGAVAPAVAPAAEVAAEVSVAPAVAPAAEAAAKKKEPKKWVEDLTARLRGDFEFVNTLDGIKAVPNGKEHRLRDGKTKLQLTFDDADCNVKQQQNFAGLVREIHNMAAYAKLDEDEKRAIDECIVVQCQEICSRYFGQLDAYNFMSLLYRVAFEELKTPISSGLNSYFSKKMCNRDYDPFAPAVEPKPAAKPAVLQNTIESKPKTQTDIFIERIQNEYADVEYDFDHADYMLKDELESVLLKMSLHESVVFLAAVLKFPYPVPLSDVLYDRILDQLEARQKRLDEQAKPKTEKRKTLSYYADMPWGELKKIALENKLEVDTAEGVAERVYFHMKSKEPKCDLVLERPELPEPDIKHSGEHLTKCNEKELIVLVQKANLYDGYTDGQLHNEGLDVLRNTLYWHYEEERKKCHPKREPMYEADTAVLRGREQAVYERIREYIEDMNGRDFFVCYKDELNELSKNFRSEVLGSVVKHIVKRFKAKLSCFDVWFQKKIIDQMEVVNVDDDYYRSQMAEIRSDINRLYV